METLVRDFRFALRTLARTPALTAVAVLALALGIGANSAIFSVVYAVLFRPFPVAAPERLAALHAYNPRFNIPPLDAAYGAYAQWRKQATCFESLGAASRGTAEAAAGQQPEQLPFWRVSASFLGTLGVAPALGRGFTPEDDRPGAPHVAILSHAFWQRRFGADAAALGRAITVDKVPHIVTGVLPPGFHVDGKPADVYAPLALDPEDRKTYVPVAVYARLKPGVTVAQAQSEMDAVAVRLDARGSGWKIKVRELRDAMVQDVRLSLLVLLGSVALVLLIACANIASLLLARAGARQRELAVRRALGAGRWRLVRQLLTESTVLALLGGAAGVLLAAWCVRLVPALQNERLPNLLGQTRIDGAVLAFTFAVSVLTGLAFGAAPAFAASQTRVYEALKEGARAGTARGRTRAWNLLVISETALALVLLVGATLLIRSFFYLRDVAPGFRVDGLFTARITLPPARYNAREPIVAFWDELLARVRAIPGVESATFANALPLGGEYMAMSMALEGHTWTRPQDYPVLWHRAVDAAYFRTLRIPLRAGRFFTPDDRAGSLRVAVVNETMARRFWPRGDAVGKHIGRGAERMEIVGVAGDVRHQDSTKEGLVEVLFPASQNPSRSGTLAVRVDPRVFGDASRVAPHVARVLVGLDANISLARPGNMQQTISDRIAPKRLSAQVIAAFAGLALLLAAIGVYGVLSFSVAQRTHEIGVRVALGARSAAVTGMVVRQAVTLALAGIAAGLVAALGLTRVLRTLLYGVSATDPAVYAGVAAAMLAVAVLAAWLPARRAARVDPVIALRQE